MFKTKKTNKAIKKKRVEAEMELEQMEQKLRDNGLQVQNKLKDEVRGAELNDRDRRLREQEKSIKAQMEKQAILLEGIDNYDVIEAN